MLRCCSPEERVVAIAIVEHAPCADEQTTQTPVSKRNSGSVSGKRRTFRVEVARFQFALRVVRGLIDDVVAAAHKHNHETRGNRTQHEQESWSKPLREQTVLLRRPSGRRARSQPPESGRAALAPGTSSCNGTTTPVRATAKPGQTARLKRTIAASDRSSQGRTARRSPSRRRYSAGKQSRCWSQRCSCAANQKLRASPAWRPSAPVQEECTEGAHVCRALKLDLGQQLRLVATRDLVSRELDEHYHGEFAHEDERRDHAQAELLKIIQQRDAARAGRVLRREVEDLAHSESVNTVNSPKQIKPGSIAWRR
jgi:hypothetical protein